MKAKGVARGRSTLKPKNVHASCSDSIAQAELEETTCISSVQELNQKNFKRKHTCFSLRTCLTNRPKTANVLENQVHCLQTAVGGLYLHAATFSWGRLPRFRLGLVPLAGPFAKHSDASGLAADKADLDSAVSCWLRKALSYAQSQKFRPFATLRIQYHRRSSSREEDPGSSTR